MWNTVGRQRTLHMIPAKGWPAYVSSSLLSLHWHELFYSLHSHCFLVDDQQLEALRIKEHAERALNGLTRSCRGAVALRHHMWNHLGHYIWWGVLLTVRKPIAKNSPAPNMDRRSPGGAALPWSKALFSNDLRLMLLSLGFISKWGYKELTEGTSGQAWSFSHCWELLTLEKKSSHLATSPPNDPVQTCLESSIPVKEVHRGAPSCIFHARPTRAPPWWPGLIDKLHIYMWVLVIISVPS